MVRSHPISIYQVQVNVSFIISILGIEIIRGTLGSGSESFGGETFGGGGGGGGGDGGRRGTRVYCIRPGGAVPRGKLRSKLVEEINAACDAKIFVARLLRTALRNLALAAARLVVAGFIDQWRWAIGVRIAATIVHCCRPRDSGLPVGSRRRRRPLAKTITADPTENI